MILVVSCPRSSTRRAARQLRACVACVPPNLSTTRRDTGLAQARQSALRSRVPRRRHRAWLARVTNLRRMQDQRRPTATTIARGRESHTTEVETLANAVPIRLLGRIFARLVAPIFKLPREPESRRAAAGRRMPLSATRSPKLIRTGEGHHAGTSALVAGEIITQSRREIRGQGGCGIGDRRPGGGTRRHKQTESQGGIPC